MKIDFSQIELNKKDNASKGVSTSSRTENTDTYQTARTDGSGISGVSVDLSSSAKNNKAYQKKTRTLADSMEDIDSYNEKNQRNYMAVMSNTLSDRDYEELVENGYAPGQMEVKDAVTSLDRMKVTLSEAGINVAGYTDTVSSDKVEEITGSASAAAALENADLPATADNVKGMQDAVSMASELEPLNDASMKYMVENEMEPTIANVYEAQYSAGKTVPQSTQGYFTADDTGSYLAKTADTADLMNSTAVKNQIDTVISDAGLEVSSDTEQDAQWLVKNGIPLNKNNLQLYEDLKQADIKPDISEMVSAVADGRKPSDAYLIKNYKNIKADRQLKEAELSMTADANLKLVKSDFSVDTSSLENEVKGLKDKEKKVWDLLDETLAVVKDVRTQPADVIAQMAVPQKDIISTLSEDPTLNEIHEAGRDLAGRYEAASKTYEAVGTEVRPDLGDSIQKAFRNVDDILNDMQLDTDSGNRRAVRILGYASMEITEENISRVKTADTKVNDLLTDLTPKNVLRLIRENVNPLETDIDTLSQKLSDYSSEDEQDSVKFSDYLVKLENSGEITEDEATSYVGIYRLVDKLVKTDGAAVGTLIDEGADINLKNLLSAVRTKKKSSVDISIDKNFSGMDVVQTDDVKIDTQIKTAFSRDYYEDSSQKFTDAAKAEEYIYRMLQNSDTAVTADNVNAAAVLMNDRGTFIKDIFDNSSQQSKSRLRKASDKVIESMDSEEGTREAYDELTDVESLSMMDGGKLDLRLMQSYHKVISLQRDLADSEQYEVPVEIEGKITSINLKIRHGEIGGKVDITFESGSLGKVAASFSLTEDTTEGTVVCSERSGEEYVNKRMDRITDALSQDGRSLTINVIQSAGLDINRPMDAMDGDDSIETAELYRTAKAFIGGIIYEDQQ